MASLVNPDQERRALLGAHVQRLTATLEWDVFKVELDKIEQQILEELATNRNEPDFRFKQGVLHGLRWMKSLPQTLIAQGRRA